MSFFLSASLGHLLNFAATGILTGILTRSPGVLTTILFSQSMQQFSGEQRLNAWGV